MNNTQFEFDSIFPRQRPDNDAEVRPFYSLDVDHVEESYFFLHAFVSLLE